LEGLFEFLEEGFDAPAATIEVGNGLRAPNKMVGQENHFEEYSVHFHERHDAAQPDGIMFGGGTGQSDQGFVEAPGLQLAHDAALQVVLGAVDLKNLTTGQVCQVFRVHVSSVENGDFTRLNIGAKLTRPDAVMLGGGVHDGAAGQEGLEIEPDMAFGGGDVWPSPASGHQLNGGRIHDVDEPLETKGEARRAVAAKGGLQRLQMFQHRPEELLANSESRVRLA
jgi:hypothetical protein